MAIDNRAAAFLAKMHSTNQLNDTFSRPFILCYSFTFSCKTVKRLQSFSENCMQLRKGELEASYTEVINKCMACKDCHFAIASARMTKVDRWNHGLPSKICHIFS